MPAEQTHGMSGADIQTDHRRVPEFVLNQRCNRPHRHSTGGYVDQPAIAAEDLSGQRIDPLESMYSLWGLNRVMQVLIDLHPGGNSLHDIQPLVREGYHRRTHQESPLPSISAIR